MSFWNSYDLRNPEFSRPRCHIKIDKPPKERLSKNSYYLTHGNNVAIKHYFWELYRS